MATTPTSVGALSPSQGELGIEERHGLQGLEQLAGDWHELFARLPQRSFVQSVGWHRAFASFLSDDPSAMRYFVFRRHGAVCALVALQELAPMGLGPLRVRRLSLPAHRHATLSDALIVPDESPREIIDALRRHVSSGSHALVVTLELPNLLRGRAALGGLDARAEWGGNSRWLIETVGASAWFDVSSRDAAFAGLSSHVRRNLARQRRRLEELGEVRMERFAGAAAAGGALQSFFELEASGWKGVAGSAIRMHPRIADFYRSLVHEFEQLPRVVIHLLAVQGRHVAGSFCVELDDTLYVLKIAYEEQLRAAAPGNCLLEQMLGDAAQCDGVRRVSLVTSPPWAKRWGVYEDELQRALVLPGGLSGLLLLSAMRARRRWRRDGAQGGEAAEALP